MKNDCEKSILGNGDCCCNCISHIEDFYHCCTPYKPGEPLPDKCRCSEHKGWICYVQFDDGEPMRAHSGWDEHSGCEIHIRKTI